MKTHNQKRTGNAIWVVTTTIVLASCSSNSSDGFEAKPGQTNGGASAVDIPTATDNAEAKSTSGLAAIFVHPTPTTIGSTYCGTTGHPAALAAQAAELRGKPKDGEQGLLPFHANQSITIPVYFHVIRSGTGVANGDVADSDLDATISALNFAYRGGNGGVSTAFKFVKARTDRTTNATWFTGMKTQSSTELAAKDALRVGGPTALNFYTADVSTANMDANGNSLGGFGEFPQSYRFDPRRDGVVFDFRGMPGGTWGETGKYRATHEVGHWLGLAHTFDTGCSLPGDNVGDTALQLGATGDLCLQNPPPDTCPNDGEGPDAVNNYMNYIPENCANQFTIGQAQLMDISYTTFRTPAVDGFTLTGPATWTTVPAAWYQEGQFQVINPQVTDFPSWAAVPGAVKLTGDFDGDSMTDILMTGPSSWGSVPVGYSNGNGTIDPRNIFMANWPGYSATPGVTRLVGDFNGDGKSDVALTGVSGWAQVRIIQSTGRGAFTPLQFNAPSTFTGPAAVSTNAKLVGDFNRDGYSDIIVMDANNAAEPMAFGSRSGLQFSTGVMYSGTSTSTVSLFRTWSALSNVAQLVGDFDGDGSSDIALTGNSGWNTIPIALSRRDGNFSVYNPVSAWFAQVASQAGVEKFVADFNADGFADIALIGGSGWNTIPIAFSNGDGTWTVQNLAVGDSFGLKASSPSVRKLLGDFDHDGKPDFALLGGTGWLGIPVAFSDTMTSFQQVDIRVTDTNFPDWASLANVSHLPGNIVF